MCRPSSYTAKSEAAQEEVKHERWQTQGGDSFLKSSYGYFDQIISEVNYYVTHK